MLNYPGTSRRALFLAGFLLTFCSHFAFAESDFERGYRDGYRKGYQDGMNSGPSGSPQWQGGGTQGIVVIRARYGDENRSCDLTARAAQRFNGRADAEVDVSNQLCGDPAPGGRKSLQLEYLCKGQTRTAEAYEHRRLSVNCY